MLPTKIYIDPTSRILYSSFYIEGLYEVFGKRNVSFKKGYFKDLKRKKSLYSFSHFFAFVSVRGNVVRRFVIDFCDPTDISKEAYDWCDVYAKINYKKSSSVNADKIVVIPPGFGIKIWNLPETIVHCARNLLLNRFSVPAESKAFIRDYWQQHKRLPLAAYLGAVKIERENFIFMIGTLWHSDEGVKSANALRMRFMESCLKIKSVDFEGGLYAAEKHPDFHEFKSYIFSTQYSLAEYIDKTKSSVLVFNTPAVHDCHGWKLAEFLALGKPIISTALSNELPATLAHGKEMHFIAEESEMRSAISHLLNDTAYREKLGKNASDYFMRNAAPAPVVKAIMEKVEMPVP